MSQRDIQKAVEKVLQEERKQQAQKRSIDRNVQKIGKANSDAQKALLGAFTIPTAILGTAIAQDNRERKRRRETKKKHTIIGTIIKFLLFLVVCSVIMNIFGGGVG